MGTAVVNRSYGSATFRSFFVSPSHPTMERKRLTVHVESCAVFRVSNLDRAILASLRYDAAELDAC